MTDTIRLRPGGVRASAGIAEANPFAAVDLNSASDVDAALARVAKIDQAEKLNELGAYLKVQRRYPASIAAFERAKALLPPGNDRSAAIIRANICGSLLCMQRYREAKAEGVEALRIDPDCALAMQNLGVVFTAMQAWYRGDELLTRALSLNENDVAARFDRAMLRLSRGDWPAGFADYEARLHFTESKLYGRFPVPHWQGEDLDESQSIFVQFEQGIGDRILMSRYLGALRCRLPRARIVTCVNPTLLPLLWGYRRIFDIEFLPDGVPWPHDMTCGVYVGSLPLLLGTTSDAVPSDPGIICDAANEHRRRAPFHLDAPKDSSALRVGLSWTGNPAQLRNEDRSVPLDELAIMAADPRLALYSLQVGSGAEQLDRFGLSDLISDCCPELQKHGFVATAQAMLQMDVIVTVCTSTAHLAGVLGVPCLLMTSYDPYWIWGRQGSSTPWYPSLTLIRQERPHEWAGVIGEVRERLAHMARKKE